MTAGALFGTGVRGRGRAVALAENGHDVRLIGTHLDRDIIDSIRDTGVHPGLGVELPGSVQAHQIEEAEAGCSGVEILLSGVNSFGVRWAGDQLSRLLPDDTLVIAIAKGLEATDQGDLRLLPDVLTERWSEQQRAAIPVSAIVGPSLAGGVAGRRDTCGGFA